MGKGARTLLPTYGVAVLAVVVAILVRWLLNPLLDHRLPFITAYGAVAIAVWIGGRGPALLATIFGFVAADLLFIETEPGAPLSLAGLGGLAGLAVYLASCLIIVAFGSGMHAARRRAEASRQDAIDRQKELEHEIVARQRAEEVVRASDARNAAALAVALDCIITIDHQGKVLEFNPAAERVFGYRRNDVLGRELADLIIPPHLRAAHRRGLAHYLATGAGPVVGKRVEMPALRADGSEFPVELAIARIPTHGAPVFTAYLRDVTERTNAERRRNARLAVTHVLAQSASVPDAAPTVLQAIGESLAWDAGLLWVVDPDSKVLRCAAVWHSPAVAIGEFERESRERTFAAGVGLPGRVWSSGKPVWIPDVGMDGNFPRAPVARRERLHGAFGFPVLHGGAVLGVIEFFSAQVREPDPDLLEMVDTLGSHIGLFMDRRKAEQALKEADRRKDEFLAFLAHELRNPLAPIRNAIELLRLADGDASLIEQARRTMQRQVGQMVRLIDDLLDISRISMGKLQLRKERVELAAGVQSAIEASRPLIEAQSHEFTVTLPREPIYLDADPTRIGQIVTNLLTNAAKYTEKGGHICLTAGRLDGEAVLSVRDTGIGIAAEYLPHVFEMFSQAARALGRSQGGLGIGLSLVRGLVEMHGGRVEAKSDGPGNGSEFIIRLPLLMREDGSVKDEKIDGDGSLLPPAFLPKRRILVADDLRDSADSLALLLRRQGHEVRTAYDGREAVATASEFRPEVALLDIGMPKHNGYETARQLRAQSGGNGMVLIALTGWGQEEDKRQATEAGFDHHLTKPVDPAALEQLLAASAPNGR